MTGFSQDSTAVVSEAQIQEIATGFWRSKTLFAGLELDIFDVLASGPLPCEELANRLRLPPDSLLRLLIGLASLGLVEYHDTLWSNTSVTQKVLVKESPHYIGAPFRLYSRDLYPLWHFLPQAIQENRSFWREAFGQDRIQTMHTGSDKTEFFVRTMESMMKSSAVELLEKFNFSSFHHLLDVGGSIGTLAVTILQQYPHMTATITDLAPIQTLAQDYVANHHLADRVQVVVADFFKDALPTGADVITLSYILHGWEDADCRTILHRCFAALEPGGTLLVLEKALYDDYTGPFFPAMMNLNMLLGTGGRERIKSDYFALLTSVGFTELELRNLTETRDIIIARKIV